MGNTDGHQYEASVPIDALLETVASQLFTSLDVVARPLVGEQHSTYVVRDASGRHMVLKWHPNGEMIARWQWAQAVTDRLRDLGVPVPRYLAIGGALGGSYFLQTLLPGAPLEALRLEQLPQIDAILACHIRQAPPGPRTWPDEVVRAVLHGGQGYCMHESLLAHSEETQALLAKCQALVRAHQGSITSCDDIVHFDFQPANMLFSGDTITGIVDWDGAPAGDVAFDWATLLFYGYEDADLRTALWSRALAHASSPVLAVYLPHLIVRQVDWSLRRHALTVAERYISRSHTILQAIAANL